LLRGAFPVIARNISDWLPGQSRKQGSLLYYRISDKTLKRREMKVILRQAIEKLGKRGDVIQVKDGHARNFLIPRGIATEASVANLNQLQQEEKKRSQQLQKEKQKAEELISRIEGLSVNVAAETYEEDKLYGSITALEIKHALEAEGIKVDKNHIVLNEPIKTLGIFDCIIKLHPEVQTKIKVWVVKNTDG
jgi:large subunit ribosomal protein L9